jgi:hypothetical protein
VSGARGRLGKGRLLSSLAWGVLVMRRGQVGEWASGRVDAGGGRVWAQRRRGRTAQVHQQQVQKCSLICSVTVPYLIRSCIVNVYL